MPTKSINIVKATVDNKLETGLSKNIIKIFANSIAMLIILTVCGIIACLSTKYDISWDLANYHYYNAFAFLHNRLGYDISPASVQTYFNPLIDIPSYYLIEYFNDNLNVIYTYQGIWFGFLLFAVYKISCLFISINKLSDIIQIILIMVLAGSGQAVLLQLGSTTNEIQVSAMTLGIIYILLKLIKFPKLQRGHKYFLSGIAMGTVLGLKPTIIYLCLASGLSLICCFKYLKRPFIYISFFALGGLVGYLLTNGWWMYKLWTLYENPFFPFANEIFQSPYFDNFNYAGTIFVPPLSKMFIFPYIWHYGEYRTIESNFTDIHGTVYYTIGLLFLVYTLLSPTRLQQYCKEKPIGVFYTVFLVLGYILWMQIFSVYRYIIVIETLSAIFFVNLLFKFQPKKEILWTVYWALVITLLYAMLQNFVQVKPWNTFKNETQKVYMDEIAVPRNTLIKAYGLPTSFIIPILAKHNEIRVLGYSQYMLDPMAGTDFADRGKLKQIKDEIEKNHQGTTIVVYSKLSPHAVLEKKLEQEVTKAIQGMICRKLSNSLYGGTEICVPRELSQKIFKK